MTEQKKKVKACKDTDYLFISAYLRAKEPQLLTAEKAGRMLGSSVQEAARILEGCGYADVLSVGLDRALNDRRTAVFTVNYLRIVGHGVGHAVDLGRKGIVYQAYVQLFHGCVPPWHIVRYV